MSENKRTIVLIPAPSEALDPQYWANFVWRVRTALERDNLLDARTRLVVADEKEPQS